LKATNKFGEEPIIFNRKGSEGAKGAKKNGPRITRIITNYKYDERRNLFSPRGTRGTREKDKKEGNLQSRMERITTEDCELKKPKRPEPCLTTDFTDSTDYSNIKKRKDGETCEVESPLTFLDRESFGRLKTRGTNNNRTLRMNSFPLSFPRKRESIVNK
jgi:hypothetical protein